MKRIVLMTVAFVFALTCVTANAGLLDIVKGGKAVTVTMKDIGQEKYAGGPYDPTKDKKYEYKKYNDAAWDPMSEGACRLSMSLEFASKVLQDPAAKKEDLEAALKAAGYAATEAPKMVNGIANFIQGITSDPTKAIMLKDVKGVGENMKTIVEKAPKVVEGLSKRVKETAGGAAAPASGSEEKPKTE